MFNADTQSKEHDMLIQEYQSEWAVNFSSISTVLDKALIGIDFIVHHIGSTSIVSLAAKPIIDIDIEYSKREDFEIIKRKLEKIGYYHDGDFGIKNREVFKRRLNIGKHLVLDQIYHHLYVCPENSEELNRHLLFRDYLRNHKTSCMEYQELKYKLADEAGQNKKIYAQIKEIKAKEFIESIIKKARNME